MVTGVNSKRGCNGVADSGPDVKNVLRPAGNTTVKSNICALGPGSMLVTNNEIGGDPRGDSVV
jgi:hypothetical protein